jgi:hypothetical protein
MKKLKSMPLAVVIAILMIGMCYSCNKDKSEFKKKCVIRDEVGFTFNVKRKETLVAVYVFGSQNVDINYYYFNKNISWKEKNFVSMENNKSLVQIIGYDIVGTDTTEVFRNAFDTKSGDYETCEIYEQIIP